MANITRNLADFTSLVPPAEPVTYSLAEELALVAFTSTTFTGSINHAGQSDNWIFGFSSVPNVGDTALFDAAIEAHTGVTFLAGAKRVRRAAEVTVSSAVFTSVLTSPFQPGPLVGGDWQLLVSVELELDTAAVWGAAGPDKAVDCQITRDGTEVAQFQWPFATYNCFTFAAGDSHAEGDNPVFDILIRRLGGSGDVHARLMKLEVAPVPAAEVEDQT